MKAGLATNRLNRVARIHVMGGEITFLRAICSKTSAVCDRRAQTFVPQDMNELRLCRRGIKNKLRVILQHS